MGGGNTVFIDLPVPQSCRFLGISFGGADGDDGRLKLTPGAAPREEAKDNGSIDLTDLLCGADVDNGRLNLTPGAAP
jgi:hypothetical protein